MMGIINTPDETTVDLYSKKTWSIFGHENMNLNQVNDFMYGKLERINFYLKENCTPRSKFSEFSNVSCFFFWIVNRLGSCISTYRFNKWTLLNQEI
jgi:hypothetical protein